MIKIKKNILFLSILFTLFINTKAQEITQQSIPADYFINPLNIKLLLAGSFGEIRSNHFHAGIDIKTNQREGYPVYAVADGFVSRMRVQIGGYGNAIYINHPNGLSSVYGHLQKFNPRIATMMKGIQYKAKSFTQDIMLTPIEIPVKKGDIIAWSGNTGSSAGPHLHFEIRNTKTEETINPLSLGFQISDHLKPIINGFYIYKTNHNSFNEFTPKQYFQTVGTNGIYTLNKVPVIAVNGEFGFGIMAHDLQDGTSNRNGLYSTTIKLDGNVIYESVINQFAFEVGRAVNAYIDYPAKITSGRVIQKGFVAPNTKVKFYTNVKNNGLIELSDNALHEVQYIVKDINGNQSELKFKIKSNPAAVSKITPSPNKQLMSYQTAHQFENGEVEVNLPKGILYDDLDFKFASLSKPIYGVSKIYQIHNKLTPIHDAFELAIKIDSNVLAYADKMLIVNTESGSQGGEAKNGFIIAKPKTFGNFYVRIDSVAPAIKPINVKEGANLSQQKNMLFKISDQLAGIESFNGYIDGEWVLMEYDLRNGNLWHTFDEKTGFGKHTFKLVVTDRKQNEKTYSINFYR
ncbi:M23 family metallopeptidase [Pedobacter cryophilus]|uniref:M23 family metallopeptidase n=1 Tax=Pedobacter cryophilus TaxID=2571271 RepID=A0A4U1C094_9SPHI|nr:M23 family metallopeptidase [Pedobacter cryophilus]TKB98902.1 M23 family metallopeptidase [Pedobacter cryophilus]